MSIHHRLPRKAPGGQPCQARKTFAKYWLDRKPQRKAASVTLIPGLSINRRAAASTRGIVRYSAGATLKSLLQ